ncbi:hypothetical protein DAH55_20130 [Sphingomonas koreensis]|uniref:hypothetical protein n=1 Tax=Sphingomonas koreensis TaxID=93064 RepID=UPI000832B843|nr:hypothetical protein [Sphingomonas koreensis]PJI88482.1 hypothetical protein BDW16_1761 [Sphingomonas koreensis]RSU55592.1 hypothetical protein DAH56_20145 [Sphingomonas koreensis]RSU64155.1 hypothetical protein DAH55_20130 [Sphingomonas koreensis]
MPRPIPVYVVDRPSLGSQILLGMLALGVICYLIKATLILAAWAIGAFIVLRIAIAWPKPFFFLLFLGGGLFLTGGSPPLMIGWVVIYLAAVTWIIRASRAA